MASVINSDGIGLGMKNESVVFHSDVLKLNLIMTRNIKLRFCVESEPQDIH